MKIRKLIPKDKFDEEVITGLKALSFEEIKPIVPDLLEWLQDLNWPIARSVADVLLPFADKISPEIIAILRTNDAQWKYGVLIVFGAENTTQDLLAEIKRIAQFPTYDEKEEEVDILAIEILNDKF